MGFDSVNDFDVPHSKKRCQSAKTTEEVFNLAQLEKADEEGKAYVKDDAESSDGLDCDLELMRQALQGQGMSIDKHELDMIIEKYGNNLKKNQKRPEKKPKPDKNEKNDKTEKNEKKTDKPKKPMPLAAPKKQSN
jgi:hypothetical protein